MILHSRLSIAQSPLLYRVSAALRDAPSCNSHHSNQLQQQQDAANAKESLEKLRLNPLCHTAVVTGHKRGRQVNAKQGLVVKMRSCGTACAPGSISASTRRIFKRIN